MGTEVNVKQNSGGSGIIIAILLFMLIASMGGGYYYYNKYHKEKTTSYNLTNSINSLQDTATTYKIKWENGIKSSAAVVEPLYLKKSNVKKLYAGDLEIAKKMGATNEDINSISTSIIETKDTAHNVPVYIDSIKSLHSIFKTNWTRAEVTIYRDRSKGADWSIQHTDSFYQTDYYKQHHIWFIKWKTKQEKSSITCKDPHTDITFFRVIKIIE
jgi:hypothetical protein